MDELMLLEQAGEIFRKEPRLIELTSTQAKQVVFIGDTHGDWDASKQVVERYFQGSVLVFLGDYVDRGPHSKENLEYLLRLKLEHPDRIYLLQGNHEAWQATPFYPADFWESLGPEEQALYAQTLAQLPWAVALPYGVLALHGALPNAENLESIEKIAFGSHEWRRITWGDWQDLPGYSLGDYGGRPQHGRDYFIKQMEMFQMRVLVRSHQPHAPQYLFHDRCLTIFTSHAYGPRERLIAIVFINQEVQTARDLLLERV